MKAIATETLCEMEDSKLFGEAYLPDEWLENDLFSIYEFFLGQINLAEFNCELLPTNGYLYFFIDTTNFKKNKMKAVVRLYEDEPSACTDFNDGLFEDDCEFRLEKDDLGDISLFEIESEKVKLISVPAEFLPFDCDFSVLSIVIDKDDLKNRKFDGCKIIFE